MSWFPSILIWVWGWFFFQVSLWTHVLNILDMFQYITVVIHMMLKFFYSLSLLNSNTSLHLSMSPLAYMPQNPTVNADVSF